MRKSDTVVLTAHWKDSANKTVIYVIQNTDFMDGVHNINIAQNAVSLINFRLLVSRLAALSEVEETGNYQYVMSTTGGASHPSDTQLSVWTLAQNVHYYVIPGAADTPSACEKQL